MTEFHERSSLFKFLYVILRVITFPIFAVLFIFTHPLWLLLLLLMIIGGAIYWPMSQGVKTDEMLGWYQEKYVAAKKDVVKTAKEKGLIDLVPQAVVDNVEKIEDEEARQQYGENYNIKIKQDDKTIATKNQLKKRSGFKKAAVSEVVKIEKNLEDMTDEEILEESGTQGGGLANLLPPKTAETVENAVEETVPAEDSSVNVEANEIAVEVEENVAGVQLKSEPEPEETINLGPKEVQEKPAPGFEDDDDDDDLDLF